MPYIYACFIKVVKEYVTISRSYDFNIVTIPVTNK